LYGLDLLRCIAILIVMVGHGNYFLPGSVGQFCAHFIPDGVQLFFVLSGFLIGGIFIRQFDPPGTSGAASSRAINGAQVLEFWKRRWFRTLPAYVLVVLTVVGIRSLLHERPGATTILQHLTFTQNLNQPPPYWFYPESWSLAIEEWFYLLLPTTVFALVRAGLSVQQALWGFALITGLGAPLLRLVLFLNADIGDPLQYFQKTVPLRLDSIAYGILGACLLAYRNDLWALLLARRKTLFFAGVGCLLLDLNLAPLLHEGYRYVLSHSMAGLGTLLLLPFLSTLPGRPGLTHRIVTHLALISYSMYLLNYTPVVHHLLARFDPTDGAMTWPQRALALFLFWTVTITLSSLLYHFWERPTTRLRQWKPRFNREAGRLPIGSAAPIRRT
jgi:peptidoglycan/LPS O-acetylase OafA/YrhL